MTLAEVPRVARIASLLALLTAAAGLLLIVAAVVDLRWWSSADAHALTALIAQIRQDRGTIPPALLRDGAGAVQLLILGALCLLFAVLARPLAAGHARARTAAVWLGLITFIVALIGIGADAVQPVDLRSYLHTLDVNGMDDQIPRIQALLYPGGYAWLEDLAQGLQALASAAVTVAVMMASVWHPGHFTRAAGKAASAEPDAWGDAISRIRAENAKRADDDLT